MNGNLRVGNLFGIPFYVNVSWFLVLALVTWNYGSGLSNAFPALVGLTPWVLGLVTALLLFSSVLAHELGHSFVAQRQGIRVNSITLFLFGGLAALDSESDTPGGAFQVAIAGPVVSLGLAVLLFAASVSLPLSGPTAAIVPVLTYINLALGLFNLLPGLPLDGGNVVKAIVWKVTGNPYQGTTFASRAGQVIGWLGIGLGVASLLGISTFGSVWTLLVGWFLLSNANRSAQSATLQQQLDRLTALDALTPESPIVTTQTSLRSFADDVLLANSGRWHKYLVVDASQQLVGTVSVDDLRSIPREGWATTTVEDIMDSAPSLTTVQDTKPLLDVVRLLDQRRLSVLAVIGDDGQLLGLLEKASIADALGRNRQVASSPLAS